MKKIKMTPEDLIYWIAIRKKCGSMKKKKGKGSYTRKIKYKKGKGDYYDDN